jgi:hypothetical protein
MQMRDKIITAICRTVEGLEWTTVKVGQDGVEPVRQESLPLAFSGETAEELVASIELPEEVVENIKGDISVPLRSADLLMRVMELPATQADEIADMAALQIDKIAPFPSDQLAFSHEVLQQSEDTSLVLMVAAKRSCIDRLGDTFKEKGIHIHSIDSRDLGWMQLLNDAGHIASEGCEIIVIADGVGFSLIIANHGIPIAFRVLHAPDSDPDGLDEIVYEIGYTLTTLDTEHDLKPPSAIQYWSQDGLPSKLRAQLAEKSGLKIQSRSLTELPPLSEGIVRRALDGHGRIELIPREWIEHEKNKQLRKKTILASSVVIGVWLTGLLIFSTIYKVRDFQLSSVKKRAAAVAPAAKQALENRRKLKALKVYTNRSRSALECLREITRLLPIGDIEFVSYNYDKSKGVSIRGTAGNDKQVDDYFVALANSTVFERLKDQSMSTKTTKGVRRTVFSATLALPSKKDGK